MPAISDIKPEPVHQWLPLEKGFLLVAGPCSVESRDQLIKTIEGLVATGKKIVVRAGIWKPRSRPGEFEGVGAKALPWLDEVRTATGLPMAVEVARPKHVELCLKHNIDLIWLGARTTVNPFMVQEIANAIKGTGIPVMIKNPVSPDLRLWVGAVERISMAGTNKIIAIHRGFHTHLKSVYRNIPLWNIPLQMSIEIPGLPVICDPSHIAGDKTLIRQVAIKAMALGMNGLMIETHHQPQNALTDPLQQITPATFNQLIDEITSLKEKEDDENTLQSIRLHIDELDYQLLELLAKRFALSPDVGKLKKKLGKSVVQPARQEDLFRDREEKAKALGLNISFVNTLMQMLHNESVVLQHNHE